MIYGRIVLFVVWMLISCFIGLGIALVRKPLRWGASNINRDFARVFSWGILNLSGIRVEVEGREHLEAHQPCIYVGNHQSGMDMATFGKIYPKHTVVIGKKELHWIPLFGLYFAAAGNLMIDRKRHAHAVAGLSTAAEALRKRGLSIWIFPEGTRNPSGQGLMPFKKGAFHMAIEAQAPIVPIVSSSLKPVLSWPEKRSRRGVVKVRVLPPLQPGADVDGLLAKTREKMFAAMADLHTEVG